LIRKEFDFVLIDLPTDWTSWALSAVMASSRVVLVTDLSVACLRQAKRTLELFDSIGQDSPSVGLVANRVESKLFKAVKPHDVRDVLDHEIIAFLSDESDAMRSAQDEGHLITDVRRRTKFASDIEKLAQTLVSESG
jgi:pilus assembly protein CpaE